MDKDPNLDAGFRYAVGVRHPYYSDAFSYEIESFKALKSSGFFTVVP
jgi:hypothetical protein